MAPVGHDDNSIGTSMTYYIIYCNIGVVNCHCIEVCTPYLIRKPYN